MLKTIYTKDEIDTLNRLVVLFLDTAELRVKNRNDITMDFWRENVDKLLEFHEKPVLNSKGIISQKQMQDKVKDIYDTFNKKRKEIEAKQEDLTDMNSLIELETIASKK